MPGIIGTLGDLTGRRLRFVTLPAGVLAAFGRVADLVQRRLRARLPWSAESIWVVNCASVNSPRSALDLDAISDGLKVAHRFVPRLCCKVWHPS